MLTFTKFRLICTGCPSGPGRGPYICEHCYYVHPDPSTDPFYQSTVKSLMYLCAAILLFVSASNLHDSLFDQSFVQSYLIGLWFSLRTHASQIWQNPQPLLHPIEIPAHTRMSLYQRRVPSNYPATTTQRPPSLHHKASVRSRSLTPHPHEVPRSNPPIVTESSSLLDPGRSASPSQPRRVSYAPGPPFYSPVLETVNRAVKDTGHIPETMTTDDFTRAVAVATVSALRHQQAHAQSAAKSRAGAIEEGAGGHDAPNWSRTTSASVLLTCTFLYALIAGMDVCIVSKLYLLSLESLEILVDVVHEMLGDFGISEKFLGVTLFALVPNTTEFMNAISFALNGNIALRQVSLLSSSSLVVDSFSAWKLDRLMRFKSVFSRYLPWWLFLHGITLLLWVKSPTLSRRDFALLHLRHRLTDT